MDAELSPNSQQYFVKTRAQLYYRLKGYNYQLKEINGPATFTLDENSERVSMTGDIELLNKPATPKLTNYQVSDLVHRLKSVFNTLAHLIDNVPNAFVDELVKLGSFISLNQEQVLFEQGDHSDAIYFLTNGKLNAFLRQQHQQVVVGSISRGEVFGEMGVLNNSDRTTGISAARQSEIIKISAHDFNQLRQKYPQLNDFITTTLIQRLDSQNKRALQKGKPLTRVIVPLSDTLELNWLFEKLSTESSVTQLNDLFSHFNTQELSKLHGSKLAHYLDNVEQRNNICHYVCSFEELEWLQLCLGRADEVWLFSNDKQLGNTQIAKLAPLFSANQGTNLETILVRQHPCINDISDTKEFIDTLKCKRWFHYATKDKQSCGRLFRQMTRKSVGLVLGGGGARGLAHLGLYQSLIEKKVTVDAIGGTSIGSVMAAAFAHQWPLEQINQHIKNSFVDINPLGDYTFPFVAISKSRRLNRVLKGVYGDKQIEDLPIPFYCISSNISDSTEKVHHTGSLWKAVRASLAIPGVISPAIVDGEFYVDGGLINNLPTNVMQQQGIGTLIAHDVSDNPPLTSQISRFPTGLAYLWQRITGNAVKVPGILEIISRSTLLAGVKRTNENIAMADIYLKPDLSDYGMLEFKKADLIKEAGYQHSNESIKFKALSL